MKNAKILLSAAGILSVIAGALAFKAQHKFSGKYFCTAVTSATASFANRYTTGILATTTLYCSQVSNATKSATVRVLING
jgi:hypothetical protein